MSANKPNRLVPTFETLPDFPPGLYSARELNPPWGDDCKYILVREDGLCEWSDVDGNSTGATFTVAELCEAE
jgi:hypothetical protein